jgi:O-antigen/teichoic acid export membrane protein
LSTEKTTSAAPKSGKDPSISRNAFANVVGYCIHVGVAFFLSPFIIYRLGDGRYGTWSLMAEVVGYYTFLDFGLRPAVSYYVAHYSARRDHERLNWSINSAFFTLAVIGLLVSIAGAAFAFAFPAIFTIGELDPAEITVAMIVMSFTIGMTLPMEVFSAVLNGCRRQDTLSVIEIISRLLVAGGIYVALRSGHGLVALSLIQLAGRAVTWALAFWWAQRLSNVSLRPGNFRRAEVYTLAKLGSMSLVINLAQLVSSRTDLLVIGAFLGVKWVTYYNIGRMMVVYASQFNFNITRAFTPHLTHLHSRGDMSELRRLFFAGTRLSGLAAIPVAGCMLAFGHAFLELWVGKAYVSGPVLLRSDSVMMVLVFAHLTRWPQSISVQMIYATGKYRFLMNVAVGNAIAHLALSLLLVKPYGLVGVAIATLATAIVSNVFLIPAHALKRFKVSLRDYLLQGIGRPVLVSVVVFVFAYWLTHFYYPSSWVIFFLEAIVTAAVCLLLCVWVGLDGKERQLAVQRARSLLAGLRGSARSADIAA